MTENQEKAHKYLNKIRDIEKGIKDKELELEALRYKASGAGAIRYDKDRVQTSPQNFMEMAMCDIIEISAEIEEDRASLEEIEGQAYSIIRRMESDEQRTILEWYYINCVGMGDVATKMYISERTAYYLKDDALESFGLFLEG